MGFKVQNPEEAQKAAQPTQQLLLPPPKQEGADSNRHEDGKWKAGAPSPNPTGRPKLPDGWIDPRLIIARVLMKYKPSEIKAFITDEEKWDMLTSAERQAVTMIATTFTHKGVKNYWEMIEKLYGKDPMKMLIMSGDEGGLGIQSTKRLRSYEGLPPQNVRKS